MNDRINFPTLKQKNTISTSRIILEKPMFISLNIDRKELSARKANLNYHLPNSYNIHSLNKMNPYIETLTS